VLTRKSVPWHFTEECHLAFNMLKKAFTITPVSCSTLASITPLNTMCAYPTSGIKLRQTPPMVFNSTHCLIFPSTMAPMLISAASSSSTSSFGCIDNFPCPLTTIPTKLSTSTFINSTAQLVLPSSYPPMPCSNNDLLYIPFTLLILLDIDQVHHIDLEKISQGREWACATSE